MWLTPREDYYDRLEAARENKQRTPHGRSIELLKSVLSEEQLKDFESLKYFIVIGGLTGTRYRLIYKKSMNIYDMDNDLVYCAFPEEVPIGDCLTGQKLWLESTGELEFLSRANVWER